MTLFDWLAVLGAMAWAPPLFSIASKWFYKSKIRVVTSRCADIGFTTYGTILNLRLAFAVEHKDIVISEIKIRLAHESGEERLLEWQGVVQNLGRMTLPNSGVMPYEKEHTVLAVKLNQKDIEERFVRFQDPAFLANQIGYIDKAVKKMSYLQGENKYDAQSFLRESEMIDLYNFNKHAFSWKSGKYKATIEIRSPEKFILIDNIVEFSLSPIDIEKLQINKNMLELDYKRIVVGFNEGDSNAEWQWAYPVLIKR